MTITFRLAGAVLAVALAGLGSAEPFRLTLLHTNDMHARVEPARIRGEELGGYARLATIIRQQLAANENPLLVDAGDVFQGTIYFNVYQGLADVAFMNSVGYRVGTLGNHEFDLGPAPLIAFAEAANFPLVCANLDLSANPALDALVDPSVVIEVGGEQIGLVGAVTEGLFAISSPGETVKMLDPVESVQAEVDRLTAQGIDKIILLSHQGYEEDLAQAPLFKGVDVIVGGHSHSLLGTWDRESFPASRGDYPTELVGADGKPVLVVQAWQWGLLLGRLTVEFDENGVVTGTVNARPIVIEASIPEDPLVASMIEAFRKPVAAVANEVIAEASEPIERSYEGRVENPMGYLLADAMLAATRQSGAVAAFTNRGGVRSGIDAGPITYGEALSVAPFNNTLVLLDVTGAELKAALEWGTGGGGLLIPSASLRYAWNPNGPEGARVTEVTLDGQPLDPAKVYRICLNSFIAGGGDGHEGLKAIERGRLDTGLLDIDAFVAYLRGKTWAPVFDGRMRN